MATREEMIQFLNSKNQTNAKPSRESMISYLNQKANQPQEPQKYDWSNAPKDLAKATINSLPTAGMIGGAMLGEGVASVPLAAAGSMAGESLKRGLNKTFFNEDQGDVTDVAKSQLNAGMEGATAEMGGQVLGKVVTGAKNLIGQFSKDTAKKAAFKAIGPVLKDYRTMNPDQIGQYALDNGLVKAGDTFESIASKVESHLSNAGQKLDEIYANADAAFKEKLNKTGFDPVRDKQAILSQAKKELANTVGGDAALSQLETYLDQVSNAHGDKPMQQAMQKYGSQIQEYLPKLKQFLKDKKIYVNQVGEAGKDLNQPVLPVFNDLQETGTGVSKVELHGQPANTMTPNTSELNTQMDLPGLPTRPTQGFNPARGEDLLPLQQQIFLDDTNTQLHLGEAQQGFAQGTNLVPRTFVDAEGKVINQGAGQTQFAMPPEKPMRPVRPEDIRNPMTPRQTNDVKSSIDKTINYSRNPMNPEPAKEVAFSSARNTVNQINLKSLEELGEDGKALIQANRNYGNAKSISNIVNDRLDRMAANKKFGLTDMIVGAGALGYGAKTGDYKGAAGIMLGKVGLEKYGAATIASLANKLGDVLLKDAAGQAAAAANPQAFSASIFRAAEKMLMESKDPQPEQKPGQTNIVPTEAPTKGPAKWQLDGAKKLIDSGIPQDQIDKLKLDKKGQDLLVQAASGDKSLKSVVDKIKAENPSKTFPMTVTNKKTNHIATVFDEADLRHANQLGFE